MRILSVALLTLVLGLAACEKDVDRVVTSSTGALPDALEQISISAFGVLTDVNGAAIAGATVTAGTETATTNEDGYWRLDGVGAGVSFGHFAFAAAGYIDGSRTVYAQPDATYEIDVELYSAAPEYRVDAAAGGTVQVGTAGASVTFGQGAFAKTDGTSLTTGEVRVAAHFLDPAAESTYRRMPGDLRGRGLTAASATDLDLLTSYGMMAVELTDASGAEVVLAEGQTATLRMPLPEAARASAPTSIPLWFFDEAEDVWIEEGTAAREGDVYVGEVSHFTFWNCDIPTDYVQLCGRVVFEDGNAADTNANGYVLLQVVSQNWGTRNGYVDGEGRFCGIVPANEALQLQVSAYESGCRGAVVVRELGSLSADTDIGVLEVAATQTALISVSGTALCGGVPVSDGSVIVSLGDRRAVVALDANGGYETSLLRCAADGDLAPTIVVSDYGRRQQSGVIALSGAGPAYDAGAVDACQEDLNDFIELSVDGTAYLFTGARAGGRIDTLRGYAGLGDELAFTGIDLYIAATPGGLDRVGSFVVPDNGFASLFVTQEGESDFPSGLAFRRERLDGRTVNVTGVPFIDSDQLTGNIEPWQVSVVVDSTSGETVDYELALRFSLARR